MSRRRRTRPHHVPLLSVHTPCSPTLTAPRLNRLPQRLDYTLIPAPLDLNKPIVDEKADLPAIIVTPSSPVFESEFFIAFLAPPPSPTFSQRLVALVPSFPSRLPSQIQLPASPFKAAFDDRTGFSLRGRIRTIILLFVLLFIMASHVVMHRIATSHPHLEFGMAPDHDIDFTTLSRPAADMDMFGARLDAQDAQDEPDTAGWFNLRAMWAPVPVTVSRFVVEEVPAPALVNGHDNDTPDVPPSPLVAA
ncbi:uncharacterized protein BXZ73DRAFT_78601 [Epithele typhae]|uniref:uncharacterized protein n=1 Tax=Epithele typhae TaxID=378194 RepID=UPI00200780E1|nr:uncharacterized protein BXZ73DRAFT_78601 [Epithele typhae]KAH9927130.1 hypothetical protein BXZ73DRAFT_78601 [Epithele typhae]